MHGSLRVGAIYTVGVASGALACANFDPYSSVVGASGGVYTIFGVHVANLALNWSEMRHGASNRWAQLLGLMLFIGLEVWYYHAHPSETTSYAAHLGGWAAGVTFGVFVLHTVQPTRRVAAIRALAAALFAVSFVTAVSWHAFTFPPDFYSQRVAIRGSDTRPCCWHAWECALEHPDDFAPSDFSRFACRHVDGEKKLASAVRGGVLYDSCAEYRAALNATV